MPYLSRTFIQDGKTGRANVMLGAVGKAAESVAYDAVDVAVAYATRQGVRRLLNQVASSKWTNAAKRWLISIDFGVTEPDALEELIGVPNSRVRIPGGLAVLASAALRPRVTFHTKAYLFRVNGSEVPAALVVGSANLSANALLVGAECAVTQAWTQPLTASEMDLLQAPVDFGKWFDQVWDQSSPAAELLNEYRNRFTVAERPEALRDEETEITSLVIEPTTVGSVELIAAMAAADSLWVETRKLYANLGAGNPGNQLEAKKGIRVFFGFTSAEVAPNHQFGVVCLQVQGHDAVERGVRFGDNQMDKVNLPAPGVDGPPTYNYSFLLFERAGMNGAVPLFRLRVLNHAQLTMRKQAARETRDLVMQGGRQYGLLFK